MKTAKAIALTLLCAAAFGCISRLAANGNEWPSQVAKVKIGMPRLEVERLLPPHPKSPRMTLVQGGSQSVTYWVDANWSVSIAFDYTGIPRDEKGKALDTYSPQNKVLTAPVLTRKKMPVVEVKSIETIEQQGGGYSPPAARLSEPTP